MAEFCNAFIQQIKVLQGLRDARLNPGDTGSPGPDLPSLALWNSPAARS